LPLPPSPAGDLGEGKTKKTDSLIHTGKQGFGIIVIQKRIEREKTVFLSF
jgi:hypothetical protein